MRLAYITCPLVEDSGIYSITLILRDYAQNNFEVADEIHVTWSRKPADKIWDDPEIEIKNLFYCNADHSSKMLGMFHRLVENGNKVSEKDPASIIVELSRKNFRQVIFDKRIEEFVMVSRVKPGKDTQYSLPEEFGISITVDANSEEKAIKKVTAEIIEKAHKDLELFDKLKEWIKQSYPLKVLTEDDLPTVHPQKPYNAKAKQNESEEA